MTNEKLYEKRKFKAFSMHPRELIHVLIGNKIVCNLPENPIFVDCGYRVEGPMFLIVVCHESYPAVPDSKMCPIIPIEWERI